jgi:hypothetical protein
VGLAKGVVGGVRYIQVNFDAGPGKPLGDGLKRWISAAGVDADHPLAQGPQS